MTHVISAASRASLLARTQVQEVLAEIRKFYPNIDLSCTFQKTTGDIDRTTSLRSLDKTDFFTKELDAMVLSGECRIAIHSAKDLPDPIPNGLKVVAITRGVDSSDSLVLKPGVTLSSGNIVATSSVRREEAVLALQQGVRFVDIRGTIEERLAQLSEGHIDGVVIAEAALVRLGLTHLHRVTLPGETVPFQGKLAVVCRDDDYEMAEVFGNIDTRKTLYVGLDAPQRQNVDHCPLIEIFPREIEPVDMKKYTHVIFTSKSAVKIFFQHFKATDHLNYVAVGRATAAAIPSKNIRVAKEETAEGIIALLEELDLTQARIFWPHSTLSRFTIPEYLQKRGIPFDAPIFYDTHTKYPAQVPNLTCYDQIIFTSPSTIDAFIEVFGSLPDEKILTPIGPVTHQRLRM